MVIITHLLVGIKGSAILDLKKKEVIKILNSSLWVVYSVLTEAVPTRVFGILASEHISFLKNARLPKD